MPRSEEDKARRKAEYLQRVATRKGAREAAFHVDTKSDSEHFTSDVQSFIHDSNHSYSTSLSSSSSSAAAAAAARGVCYFNIIPEDTIHIIACFLPARELGALSLTCKVLNTILKEGRIHHLLSRLNHHYGKSCIYPSLSSRAGHSIVSLNLCKDPAEARVLLQKSLEGGGNTGRLVTKKKIGADEYISYARYVEEAVSGYAILSKVDEDSNQALTLPPCVQGRFASVSPEHSLCRVGGDCATGGGSGLSSWGAGRRGQLGLGKRQDEDEPQRLTGGLGYGIRIVQVSAGGGLVRVSHSLLLTSTGRVLSFGCAQYGALGHGYSAGKQLRDILRPQYVESLSNLICTCVSAGELHSAVCTSDGDVYSWGDAFCGQLGHGDKRPQLLPRQVTEGSLGDECVLSVSCGARHTLCVTEVGEVFSFGLGHFGALGRSYTPFQYHADRAIESFLGAEQLDDAIAHPPVAATNPDNFAHPHASLNDLEFLSDDMRRHLDLLGTLTLDDNSDQCIPKLIDSLKGIQIIGSCAGHRHSILLDNYGDVYTFGTGALGHGNNQRQDYPMKVLDFEHNKVKIIQISAGVDISMAVSNEGHVYAWGKSSRGQLGIDSGGSEIFTPRKVTLKDANGEAIRAVDVECGYEHSLVICLDGTVHFCGRLTKDEEVVTNQGQPYQLKDFNIWHRIAEFKEVKPVVKWKKYGKYEVKGRSTMMEEPKKWS